MNPKCFFVKGLFALSVPLALYAAQLNDFTLFSNAELIMSDRVAVRNGLLGSNTYTELGIDDTLNGNVVAKNNMLMRERSKVYGKVTLSGTLTRYSQAYVSGTVTERTTVSAITIPQSSFSAGTSDFTVNAGTTATLDPGSYRNVQVYANAKVYLRSGSYNLAALKLDPDVTLYLDCAHGVISINVLSELKIADRDKLLITAGSFNPSDVAIYTHQTSALQIGTDCRIEAMVTAPRCAITVSARTVVKGKVRANKLSLSPDVKVENGGFIDTDRDGMADGWEIANGLNPNVNDAHNDGDNDAFENIMEFTCRTDPRLEDTDADQLKDGEEYAYWQGRTDSIGWDDDVELRQRAGGKRGDGIPNILDSDSDDDGIPDGLEVKGWAITVNGVPKTVTADPAKLDSDGDGILDADERAGYDIRVSGAVRHVYSDPNKKDTDEDGIDDGVEKAYGVLDPAAKWTDPYRSDPKWIAMVEHLGEWAAKPVSSHIDPERGSSVTSIRDIRVKFHDNASTVIDGDMGMGFYFYISPEDQDRGPISLRFEFIGTGDLDGNDRFYNISYTNEATDEGDPGSIQEQYTGPETKSITWTVTDPAHYVTGDYHCSFMVHYDKDAGETPRVLAMDAVYSDGTPIPIEYFEPGVLGNYRTPLHVNLLVAGAGANPVYLRGETPFVKTASLNTQYSSIDSVKVTDFWGNTVNAVGRNAFSGYGFQYELGALPAYTGPESFYTCNHVEFDWMKDQNSVGRCIVHIDEAGDDWKDAQITYDSKYFTQDYYCWSSGLATDTAVIRRGHSFRVVATNWRLQNSDASITVRNRAGQDVTSSFTISKETGMDYPAYDGTHSTWRENWTVQVPATLPLGKYIVTAACGSWTGIASLYVIFDILESTISEGEYRGYCYDEDFDGTSIPFAIDNGRDEYDIFDGCQYPLDPYSKMVTDFAVALAEGKTQNLLVGEAIRKFSNKVIYGCWDQFGCAASMQSTARIDVLISESQITLEQTLNGGTPANPINGQCNNFAALSVALLRSIGIPSRMATGGGQYGNGPWVPNLSTCLPDKSIPTWGYHVWSEAWLVIPPSGSSDHWYVFDATDYVGSESGCSSSRKDYGRIWFPSDARVTVWSEVSDPTPIPVTSDY
jgi:hypothetical protein